MADILFLPTCSVCGTVLWGKEIDIEEDFAASSCEESTKFSKHPKSFSICPFECPKCTHMFESIIIPTKLPFITPENPSMD